MLRTTTATIALLAISAPAFAQELTYGQFGLDLTDFSAGGGDDRQLILITGAGEFTIDQFVLGAEVNNRAYDFGGGAEFDVLTYSLYGAYAVMPEVLVGLGLTSVDADGTELSGYEFFAQYVTPAFGVAVNHQVPEEDFSDSSLTTVVGEAEVSTGITLGGIYETYEGEDIAFYALTAEYAEGPIFARAFYQALTETDTTILGLRGSYAINDMFSANAGLLRVEDFILAELTGVSVGAEYAVNDAFSVRGEIGQLDGTGNTADFFKLSVTYEVGAGARLDRTMTEAIRDDRNFGLSAVAPTFGIGAGTSFY